VRRIVAFLISLMLLLPAGSVSAQAFFCQMRGKLTAKCCCPNEKAERPSSPSPSASQGDCCDERTLHASAERRSVTAFDELPAVPPPVVLALLPVTLPDALPTVRVSLAPPRARAPPPTPAAPFFILHRAFLS